MVVDGCMCVCVGGLSSWLNKNKTVEKGTSFNKTLARTQGDKEGMLHWPSIVEGKIAAEASQKTQHPPPHPTHTYTHTIYFLDKESLYIILFKRQSNHRLVCCIMDM